MSNQTRVTLRNILTALLIVIMASSVIGAAYIGYDNAKAAKTKTEQLEQKNSVTNTRLTVIETKQARFEGIMDERTKATAKRVDDIYDIVKEWRPK